MDRKKLALAILLLCLAAAITYSLIHWPRERSVKELKYTAGMKVDRLPAPVSPDKDQRVRLDLLDREMLRFTGFRRNIFRPIYVNPEKMPSVPQRPAKPIPPPPPPPPPPPKTPAEIAMEEVGRFVFLGYLQKENRKTVFLTKDNQIFLLKKGDNVAGKYKVADISESMLTIALAAGGEQVVIPLVQNRPLRR